MGPGHFHFPFSRLRLLVVSLSDHERDGPSTTPGCMGILFYLTVTVMESDAVREVPPSVTVSVNVKTVPLVDGA